MGRKEDIGLRSIPCLANLDPKELEQLEQKATIKRIIKNELIFKESEPVRFIFVVRSGLVKLFKTLEKGGELIIEIMERGRPFLFCPIDLGRGFYVNAQVVRILVS